MFNISRYLQKYKGTYRVKAFYDMSTNDYPRVLKNNTYIIDPTFDDLYIPCKGGSYIIHHSGSILFVVVPSIGKGHNIIKAIFEDKYGDNTSTGIAYKDLYKTLIDEQVLTKVEETDKELLIYFPDKNMKILAKYFKPQTNGANISIFSTKNLPKAKYKIPEDDENNYKEIVSNVKNMLDIKKYNEEFLKILNDNYKTDMKKLGLKGKNYIHSIGKWNEYLDFLYEKINNKRL